MRTPALARRSRLEMNMTPMIDVVFLLIIFFLVSSHLAKQEVQAELSLPAADTGQEPQETGTRRLTINVVPESGEFLVKLGAQPVTLAELRSRLQHETQTAGRQPGDPHSERPERAVSSCRADPAHLCSAGNLECPFRRYPNRGRQLRLFDMRIPSHHFDSAGRRDATMTPMIDVVFLLLIFFICTASFQIAEQNLPSAVRIESAAGTNVVEVEPEQEDLPPLVLKIYWRNNAPDWELNGQRCATWSVVRQRLSAAATVDTNVPVILDVAAEVPLEHVIRAYDLSRATGFELVQFAASVDA